jgi:hypothetical protein
VLAALLAAPLFAACEAADLANPPDPTWTAPRGFENDWSQGTREARRRR